MAIKVYIVSQFNKLPPLVRRNFNASTSGEVSTHLTSVPEVIQFNKKSEFRECVTFADCPIDVEFISRRTCAQSTPWLIYTHVATTAIIHRTGLPCKHK